MTPNKLAAVATGLVLLWAGVASAQGTPQYGYPAAPGKAPQQGQMQGTTGTPPMPGTSSRPQQPGIPSTGAPMMPDERDAGMPGVPNTGAGGTAQSNVIALGMAAIAALAGAGYLLRRHYA